MFSFDGVHPSDTGHAVVANVLLDTIKSELGDDPRFAAFEAANPVDEKAVYSNDPHRDSRQVLVLERSALEQPTYDACRLDPTACPNRGVMAWQALLQGLRGAPLPEQVSKVNRFVNQFVERVDNLGNVRYLGLFHGRR